MSQEHKKEEQKAWSEEFRVMGEDLLSTLNELFHDVTVSRIVVRNKQGRTLVDIPLTIGAAGVVLTLPYSIILLGVLWLTEFHIMVERKEAHPDVDEPESAAAVDEEEAEVADEPADEPVSAEQQRCQAITKAGTQCKRNAQPGSDFCGIHQS